MKVNSNLSQRVSTSHEGSVTIPLEFPSKNYLIYTLILQTRKVSKNNLFSRAWATGNPRARGANVEG